MSRRALDRFSVRQPSEGALRRYYRLYDGATLHQAPSALPEISSASLFGNAHPLALDLGCGRGEFLIDQATRHPECNYVGLDHQRKYLYDAVNHAEPLNLPNLLLLHGDLRQMLVRIPPASVAALYLLFPPPVMRRKYLRKDVLTPHVIANLGCILSPDGRLTFVTDHRVYFEEKRALLTERFECLATCEGIEGGITWFQRVWESHGLPSLRAEFRKASAG